MNWLTVIVHWLHVLFAVTWFGGHISRVLLVEPAVRTLPAESQAAFNRYVEKYATRIYVPVIIGVGITGILRGTVVRPGEVNRRPVRHALWFDVPGGDRLRAVSGTSDEARVDESTACGLGGLPGCVQRDDPHALRAVREHHEGLAALEICPHNVAWASPG